MAANNFLKEIQEQPEALQKTWNYYKDGEGKNILQAVVNLWKIGKYDKLIFTGMGSSYFISYAATCMLSHRGISSFALNAGELLHYQMPVITEKSLLVCISQSGESYEVIKLIEKLPKGITVLSICNEAGSSLVRYSKYSLLCLAGKEEMTSSKTFISCYLVAYLLSLGLSGCLHEVKERTISEIIKQVSLMVSGKTTWLPDAVKLLGSTPFVQLIGRGAAFASISQSALMFMEAARTPASALLGGEFRHGPFEMVKEGFVGIILAHSASEAYEQSLNLIKDIRKYNGKVIFVTDRPIEMEDRLVCVVSIPCEDPELFAIPGVIPMQLMINQWAIEKGLTPGEFTHGAKVTIIE